MADTNIRRGRVPGVVLALLLVVATTACQKSEPMQPPDSRALWHAALAEASHRPVRVVVLSDSMGELSLGYKGVWNSFHGAATFSSAGTWYPPRRFNGVFGWDLLPGEPAAIGIEARGQLLRQGDGPAGTTSNMMVPTTLDVYYTARPDGAPLEVRVAGATIATIDTSLDEFGGAVTEQMVAQRWRSPRIAGFVPWQVEAVGPGVAAVESVATPPAVGIEVHGTGRSGASTRNLLDSGYPLGHIEAMVARGEPPDLVVWGADTADANDSALQSAALIEALDETRRIAPGAAIAHFIPTGHNGRADWATWAELYRVIDGSRGAIVLDGYAALGDVSTGAPNAHYAADGVHLNGTGQVAMEQAWIEALAPGPVTPLAPPSPWHRSLGSAHERPVRVVVLADAAGERSGGFGGVWRHFHSTTTSSPSGTWSPPRPFDGATGWDLVPGEPSDIGIDGTGLLLRAGDGPAGMTTPVAVTSTLDLFYTARPDGAPLDVRVDGATIATVDTSLDEFGVPVTQPTGGQRWRSSGLATSVTWQVEVVGPGVAALEAMSAPPATGIEVHGTGRADTSTRELLDSGAALGHLEAMVARGEAPDLVVWAADTAPSGDLGTELMALNDALARTRLLLPGASVLHYIPPTHGGRADWPAWVPWYLGVGTNHRAVTVDGFAALGDISVGAQNAYYGIDGTNLNPDGQAVLDQAFIAALAPPGS